MIHGRRSDDIAGRKFIPSLVCAAKWGMAALAIASISGCSRLELFSTPPAVIDPTALRAQFTPVTPVSPPVDKAGQVRINLGRQLFFDDRLSKNHNESCNTCHTLTNYGVDNRRYSLGSLPGVLDTPRNTPTVYNAGYQLAQFWDGRAVNLIGQARGPLVAPREMDLHDLQDAVDFVNSVPVYVQELKQAFPNQSDPVNIENITASIAAFEGGLVTPSAWDRYLAGDTSALTESQKRGLKTYLTYGCNMCHSGRDMGGGAFQRLGDVYIWGNKNDPGREKITHSASDFMFFKVPTLRNVAKTAPYFQDGSVPTLPDAIHLMAHYQVGQPISNQDANSIADFLGSLTGTLPASYIAAPVEPPIAQGKAAGTNRKQGGRS